MEVPAPQPAPSGRIVTDYFLHHVPLSVLESIYNDIGGLYESTYAASVAEAGPLFGKRAWPQLREAAINQYLATTLAERHAAEGITVISTNNFQNTHPFTIVQAGPVWFSVHCVHGHLDVPRFARWRNELARYIWQGRLFDPWRGNDPTASLDASDPLHGYLIHIPAGGGLRRPYLMGVQFPNERADAYIPGAMIDVPKIIGRPDFGFDEDHGLDLGPA